MRHRHTCTHATGLPNSWNAASSNPVFLRWWYPALKSLPEGPQPNYKQKPATDGLVTESNWSVSLNKAADTLTDLVRQFAQPSNQRWRGPTGEFQLISTQKPQGEVGIQNSRKKVHILKYIFEMCARTVTCELWHLFQQNTSFLLKPFHWKELPLQTKVWTICISLAAQWHWTYKGIAACHFTDISPDIDAADIFSIAKRPKEKFDLQKIQ